MVIDKKNSNAGNGMMVHHAVHDGPSPYIHTHGGGDQLFLSVVGISRGCPNHFVGKRLPQNNKVLVLFDLGVKCDSPASHFCNIK